MKAAIVGFGAVGARAAGCLLAEGTEVIVMRRKHRHDELMKDLSSQGVTFELIQDGPLARRLRGFDALVVAASGGIRPYVLAALEAGVPVVTVTDHPGEVRGLLALDAHSREMGTPLAVGAAMTPGLSCVLASWAAMRLDEVSEVHVASLGTGGPDCARRHHSALSELATEWREGTWLRRPAGSGRELVWFPEPIGGADCYRVNRPDPSLLVPKFSEARRITSRSSASRRDRLTSWLPMLRPPHPEGTLGAVRVEVRGWRDGSAETVIVGSSCPPAQAAGSVAALTALLATREELNVGAAGLASLVRDPGGFLKELTSYGIGLSRFEGVVPEDWRSPRREDIEPVVDTTDDARTIELGDISEDKTSVGK